RRLTARRVRTELLCSASQAANVVQPGVAIEQTVVVTLVELALRCNERLQLQQERVGVDRVRVVLPGAGAVCLEPVRATCRSRRGDDDWRAHRESRVATEQ